MICVPAFERQSEQAVGVTLVQWRTRGRHTDAPDHSRRKAAA